MLDRRGFLLQASAALGSARAAASDRINVGFIGLGIRAFGLLDSFQKMPDVNLPRAVDLYDGHLRAAEEFSGGKMKLGKEYRDVLDDNSIDAVVIATPDHWHAKMTIDALSAGKHVYCEKPLTWAPSEGAAIKAAERKSGKILQVGSQGKSTVAAQRAREIVKSGVLGDINLVRRNRCMNGEDAAWRYAIPADASPATCDWSRFLGNAPKLPWSAERFFRWRCWWDYSGGLATDLMVHEISMLHAVLDTRLPRSVVSDGGNYVWKDGRTVPDQLSSIYEYPQGFTFLLSVNQGNSYGDTNYGLIIMGSQATLILGGKAAPLTLLPEAASAASTASLGSWPRAERERYLASIDASRKSSRHAESIPVEADPNDPADRGNYRHVRFFLDAVKGNGKSAEDGEFGHNAALAAHMANRSYREKRRIEFNETTV